MTCPAGGWVVVDVKRASALCFLRIEKYQEVPRSTKKYQEVPRSIEKYREVSRSTKKSKEVLKSTKKYLEVHRSIKKYNEVSCNMFVKAYRKNPDFGPKNSKIRYTIVFGPQFLAENCPIDRSSTPLRSVRGLSTVNYSVNNIILKYR